MLNTYDQRKSYEHLNSGKERVTLGYDKGNCSSFFKLGGFWITYSDFTVEKKKRRKMNSTSTSPVSDNQLYILTVIEVVSSDFSEIWKT